MANGDIAAGVGYDVLAGTEDRRLGYDEINKTRDYLAQHRLSGTHSWTRIIGLDDQLDAIRNKPYTLRVSITGASSSLAQDEVNPAGTFTVATKRGSFTGPDDETWQFHVPVSGVYAVQCTAAWDRTSPTQSGAVWLQLRQSMAAGNPDSGTVLRNTAWSIEQSTAAQISLHQYLVAGSRYGWTINNLSSNAIARINNATRVHYSIMYETPVGELP